MSRRSHAFATGQPAFSWRVSAIERTPEGKGTRFLCECKNHPAIRGFGDSEEAAIRAASAAMRTAVDTDEVGLTSRSQQIAPAADPTTTPSEG